MYPEKAASCWPSRKVGLFCSAVQWSRPVVEFRKPGAGLDSTWNTPSGCSSQRALLEDTFCQHMEGGKNSPQCNPSGHSHQRFHSPRCISQVKCLTNTERVSRAVESVRYQQRDPGCPHIPHLEDNVVFTLPPRQVWSLFTSASVSLHACASLLTRKQPCLIPETYLIEPMSCLMSLQIRKEIARGWSCAALLMKKRNVIIEVESP